MDSAVPGQFRYNGIYQLFRTGIQVAILLLALGFCQPIRKLHQHHLHLGIVEAAVVDGIYNLCDAVSACLAQIITKIGLLLIDLQQILTEDFLRQIALDGSDSFLR